MRRREILGLLGGAAAWPQVVQGQRTAVVGYIGNASPDAWAGRVQAFRRGLGEAVKVHMGGEVGLARLFQRIDRPMVLQRLQGVAETRAPIAVVQDQGGSPILDKPTGQCAHEVD